MASEVISHAIFCLFPSHPTPHRIVFHSASHPTLASRPALRSTSHPASRPSLHSTSHPALRPASRLSSTSHPALHSSPYSAQPCSHPASHHALHPAHRPPPFPSSSLSQVSSSSSHRQAPPSTSLHLPHVHQSPIRVSPSLSGPQSSPFTPYFTPHPIMPFTLRTDPSPHHPFPSHFFAPQDSFSQVPPSTSLHLPPVHQSPIRVSPSSVFLSQAPSPRISPRIPSCPSPCAPTPFPTTHFHRTSLLPRIPLAKPLPPRHSIFLPSINFPSAYLHPSLFLSQAPSPRTSPRIPSCPSPCAPTPFPTTHFHLTSLLPRIPLAKSLPPRHSIFLPSANFPSASLHPPCSSAKPRLWIFSCVKRPGSLTT